MYLHRKPLLDISFFSTFVILAIKVVRLFGFLFLPVGLSVSLYVLAFKFGQLFLYFHINFLNILLHVLVASQLVARFNRRKEK